MATFSSAVQCSASVPSSDVRSAILTEELLSPFPTEAGHSLQLEKALLVRGLKFRVPGLYVHRDCLRRRNDIERGIARGWRHADRAT